MKRYQEHEQSCLAIGLGTHQNVVGWWQPFWVAEQNGQRQHARLSGSCMSSTGVEAKRGAHLRPECGCSLAMTTCTDKSVDVLSWLVLW